MHICSDDGDELPAGEIGTVWFSGTPELTDELIGFCRSRIAHYKAPRSLSFEDELPRLPSGKMLRRLLMDRYHLLPPS